MRKPNRITAIGLTSVAVIVLGASIGTALWSDQGDQLTPTSALGTVAFGVKGGAVTDQGAVECAPNAYPEPVDFTMSEAGAPVTVTVPGCIIASIMHDTGLAEPMPITWGFAAQGRTPQSLGLDYSISAVRQQRGAGEYRYDLPLGIADPETVLHFATMRIYRGTANLGECENVPPLPAAPDDGGRTVASNIVVYPGGLSEPDYSALTFGDGPDSLSNWESDIAMIAPGIENDNLVSDLKIHNWCVAVTFRNADDLPYFQTAIAQGRDAANKEQTAVASWAGGIAFPPRLPLAGYYVQQFSASGIGLDWSQAGDSATWWGQVYPDTTGEPDVIIQLDPAISHIDKSVKQQADYFCYADAGDETSCSSSGASVSDK